MDAISYVSARFVGFRVHVYVYSRVDLSQALRTLARSVDPKTQRGVIVSITGKRGTYARTLIILSPRTSQPGVTHLFPECVEKRETSISVNFRLVGTR